MVNVCVPRELQRKLGLGHPSRRRSKRAAIVSCPRFWYNTAQGSDMPFDESDKALVERVKQGDARAFGTLHRRYYPKIYRLALLKTNNADDAADVASETFCKALEHLPGYEWRRCDSLYPWLHRIASNLIIDAADERNLGISVGEVSDGVEGCLPLLSGLRAKADRHGHGRVDGNRAQVTAFLRIRLNIVCRAIGDVNRAVGIHVAIFAELHQDFARRFRLRQCRRRQSISFPHRQQTACFWRVDNQAGRR